MRTPKDWKKDVLIPVYGNSTSWDKILIQYIWFLAGYMENAS